MCKIKGLRKHGTIKSEESRKIRVSTSTEGQSDPILQVTVLTK